MNNEEPNKFVSRGGIKLQAALDAFKIDIHNLVVLDVGSSTGGFVDCLLQNGASKVYSVDTAYGELAWKLRNDPRVVVLERTNILHLQSIPSPGWKAKTTPFSREGGNPSNKSSNNLWISDYVEDTDEKEGAEQLDLITIDASWTKLEKILPVVQKFLKPDGKIIALLKPHYEADKSLLVKGVLPEDEGERVKEEVEKKIYELGFKIEGSIESPILGGGGNKEYLLVLTFHI